MAQRVVDGLEVVKVHEQHRDGLVIALLPLDGVRDAVVEQRPVREARHRVVERLVRELLLEGLAFADVARVQHDAVHVRVVHQVRAQGLDEQVGTVVVADPELDESRVSLGLVQRRQERQHAGLVVGVDQVRDPRALQLGRVEPEHAGRRRARVSNRGVGVEHGDHVRGVLDQRGEALLALLDQQVFGEGSALEGQCHL
ncbi:MAG: hypothetical protein M3O98_09675 [Actinomycetota bacterium]|nr:hypothetical protein [Actinomycetota bacterium]